MSTGLIFRPVGDVEVVEFGMSKLSSTGDIDVAFDFVTERRHVPKVLIDLVNVRKMESSVIRQLEVRSQNVAACGGEVRFMHITNIKDTRTASQLAMICPVHEDESEAVRSFK